MDILGLYYIILFEFKKVNVVVKLVPEHDLRIGEPQKEIIDFCKTKRFKHGDSDQKWSEINPHEFLEYFYNNQIPSRELYDVWGIELFAKRINGRFELFLNYRINGDHMIAQVTDFALVDNDDVKIISYEDLQNELNHEKKDEIKFCYLTHEIF